MVTNNVTVTAFNMSDAKQRFSLLNTGDYDLVYSGGTNEAKKITVPYLRYNSILPYLYIFHENTTPSNPNIKREDVVKIKKILQANTNVSIPVKSNDILQNSQGTVTSVDSEARRAFFELLDVASDEFSDGGKDITSNEQVDITNQFLNWFNKDLPWAKAKNVERKDLVIKR